MPSAPPHPDPNPAAGADGPPRPERIDRPRRPALAARPGPAIPTVATGPAPSSDAVSANDGAAASASLAASTAIAAADEGFSGNGHGHAAGPGTDSGTGSGSGDSDAMEAYLSDVRARLQRSLIYPPKARRIGLRGEVRIRMRILADGSIDPDSIHVVGEGGNPVLIAGALETVERVALTPPPRPRLEIVAPIYFRLD
ncbi:TonB family protein [Magnetospirillum fulvum]|uniref:TonB family protein n=1 Tax=Magnetospirillum fulvum TaxID=1082 RepID=UPI0009444F42|nr:TonB family protein [Magnetospirillum fulvum]